MPRSWQGGLSSAVSAPTGGASFATNKNLVIKLPMKTKRTLIKAIACTVLGGCIAANAQTIKTWTGGDGNFFDPSYWDAGTVPGADPTDIAVIDNGSTATILATDGTRTFGGIHLGDVGAGTGSGNVIMNGGTLRLSGTAGDPKAELGASSTLSTFIMNGGIIYFDGPDAFPGSTGDDGVNGLDWEVGEKGLGRFEMHNDAQFF